MMRDEIVAGVELGGTKAVMMLARGRTVIAHAKFPTFEPEKTLPQLRGQLDAWKAEHDFAALGIASFGPVRVDPSACDYGSMLATPKPRWSGAPIAGILAHGLGLPWRIETDVNAAAMAEWHWGAGRGLGSRCYLTLGTGVGGGILIDGLAVHGALHPEVGHLRLRRAAGDGFTGVCPFHHDCVEGLISGPALHARFGRSAEEVSEDDPVWANVAHDLAELIGAIVLTASPQRILIGGSIGLDRSFLLQQVRALLVERLAGYLPHIGAAAAQAFISNPELGHEAGPLGAIAVGYAALDHALSATKKVDCV